MHHPDGLPILGQAASPDPAAANGGVASIDRRYWVVLTTADGVDHDYKFRMGRPTTPDGSVDLGALKEFDPARHAVEAVAEKIMHAWYAPPSAENALQRVTDEVGRTEVIVWRHVVSFRYAGPG